MVRIEFDIPDYSAWSGLGGQNKRVAMSLAEAHAQRVELAAKENAPVRSGTLRDSIRAYPLNEKRGVLEATAPHAEYVHGGTGIYGPRKKPIEIKPNEKKALYWPGAKHPAKRVRQKGIRPNHFLRLAMRQSLTETQVRMALDAVMPQAAITGALGESTTRTGSGFEAWKDYWNWGEFGEGFARHGGNFVSGYGDTVSSGFGLSGFIGRVFFGTRSWDRGLSGWARLQSGTDQYVDTDSWLYAGGTVAADVWLTVLTGRVGSWRGSYFKKGMNRPNKAFPRGIERVEGSHWIPKRLLPESLIDAKWNIKNVWGSVHALSDPYRYQFMRKWWKGANEMYNPLHKHWTRMPYWLQGGSIGATTAETARISRSLYYAEQKPPEELRLAGGHWPGLLQSPDQSSIIDTRRFNPKWR